MKKEMDRETLVNLARTALRTKLSARVADILTEVGGVRNGPFNTAWVALVSRNRPFEHAQKSMSVECQNTRYVCCLQ